MKSVKLSLLLCLIVSIEITLCGCWNYTDIEKYAIVSGFAIDLNEQGNKYVITVEVVDYQMVGKEAKQVASYVESEGTTLFDAIRNAINITGKKLYWAHTDVLIISQAVAKEGIVDILDFINRDPEMREEMYVLVSKEKTAKEVIKQEKVLSPTSSINIQNMMNGQSRLGKAPTEPLYRISAILGEDGISCSLPSIGLEENSGKKTATLKGTAIFKSDRLVGFLDAEETKYFLFAIDKINKGDLTLKEEPSSQRDDITLEIFKTKTKIKPEYSDNKLSINIDIKTEASIAEIGTNEDYIKEKKRAKLKNDADKALKESVQKVIKKVQSEYDTDIFGFGMLVKADLPSVWKAIEPQWEKYFKALDVNVTTDVNFKNSALLSTNLKKGD